jgi:hypothetical protein
MARSTMNSTSAVMLRKFWLASLCTLLCVVAQCFLSPTVVAQSAGTVEVIVTDAATKEPIPLASVVLLGPASRSVRTGPDGRAVISDVPPGTYAVVVTHSGFDPARLPSVTVADGTVITAQLAKPLQRIGTSSTIAIPAPPATITAADPRKTFATNVASLLDALPNTALVPLANGGTAVSQLGDPAQSGVTVDGMRLGSPGTPLDLRSLPLGLFETASATSNGTENLSGAVDLGLPEPTLSSLIALRLGVSGTDQNAALSARGTAGNVGYAGVVAWSANDSRLQGKYYIDQTGFAYDHHSSTAATAGAVKLRVPLSLSNVISTTALFSDAPFDDTCQILSRTPCGYGPNAQSRERIATIGIRDTGTIGRVGFSVSADSSQLSYSVSRPFARFVNIATPLSVTADVRTQAIGVTVEPPHIGRHALAVGLTAIGVSATAPDAAGTAFPSGSHRFAITTLSDTVSVTPRDSVQGAVFSTATDTGSGLGASLSAVHTVSRGQRLQVGYSAGRRGFPQSQPIGFSQPSDVRYDCGDRIAITQGPGSVEAASPRENELHASWTRNSSFSNASVTAYRRDQYGAPVPTLVDALGVADTAYVGSVASAFASPLVCGPGNAPIVLAQIPVLAGKTTYEGFIATSRITASNRLQFIGSAALTHAFVSSGPAILGNAYSTVYPGAQLPGIPRFSASVTSAYALSTATSFVGSLHYLGRNDFTGHNGLALVNVGMTFATSHGIVAAALTNAFDSGTSEYSSFSGPIVRNASGGGMRLLQYPLAPRAIVVSFRAAIGRPIQRRDAEVQALAGQTQSSSLELQPFPQATPSDPFDIATDSADCGPERAAVAKAAFMSVQTFASNGAAADGTGPFGLVMARRSAPRPTVLFGSTRPDVMAALFACGHIHGGEPAEIQRLGLYVATKTEANRYDLLYTPSVGIYITGQLVVAEERLTVRDLKTRPADAFATIASPSCPAERARITRPLLEQLRAAFSTAPPSGVSLWTIVSHRGARTWYELRLKDSAAFADVLACADVAQSSPAELSTLGLGAVSRPALNYADGVGLYSIP